LALRSPFRMMYTVFRGFGLSFLFGSFGGLVVYLQEGPASWRDFTVAYLWSFNTLVSFGLILGTAMIIARSLDVIPNIVEEAFSYDERAATKYRYHKKRYRNIKLTAIFSAQFGLAAYGVFYWLCGFDLRPVATAVMVVAACVQWSLGVYVGRKMAYAGMMLHSLLDAPVNTNLFKDRKLDGINSYVNITSTLTVLFVYINVRSYVMGPLKCATTLGDSVKIFLFLPALIATPVLLIFNFYPRAVLRRVYGKSIEVELAALREQLHNDSLSTYEKHSYILAFDKMYREELRYDLKLTLSDLPIVLTLSLMYLEPLIRHA
jgi:hypothetical protein